MSEGLINKKDTELSDKINSVSRGGILIFPCCLRLGLEMIWDFAVFSL